jgi:hypothetical protein
MHPACPSRPRISSGCGLDLGIRPTAHKRPPTSAPIGLPDEAAHPSHDRCVGVSDPEGPITAVNGCHAPPVAYRGAIPAVTGGGPAQAGAPFLSGRTASAPAAPVIAAPPADATTSHRPAGGSSRHDARLATTSRASDRAPAATHALADPGSAASRWSALSAPSPRARSRAPRARPNTRAARSSRAAPTHGRAGTEGQARAVRPSATRPAATAQAPRRSSAGSRAFVRTE